MLLKKLNYLLNESLSSEKRLVFEAPDTPPPAEPEAPEAADPSPEAADPSLESDKEKKDKIRKVLGQLDVRRDELQKELDAITTTTEITEDQKVFKTEGEALLVEYKRITMMAEKAGLNIPESAKTKYIHFEKDLKGKLIESDSDADTRRTQNPEFLLAKEKSETEKLISEIKVIGEKLNEKSLDIAAAKNQIEIIHSFYSMLNLQRDKLGKNPDFTNEQKQLILDQLTQQENLFKELEGKLNTFIESQNPDTVTSKLQTEIAHILPAESKKGEKYQVAFQQITEQIKDDPKFRVLIAENDPKTLKGIRTKLGMAVLTDKLIAKAEEKGDEYKDLLSLSPETLQKVLSKYELGEYTNGTISEADKRVLELLKDILPTPGLTYRFKGEACSHPVDRRLVMSRSLEHHKNWARGLAQVMEFNDAGKLITDPELDSNDFAMFKIYIDLVQSGNLGKIHAFLKGDGAKMFNKNSGINLALAALRSMDHQSQQLKDKVIFDPSESYLDLTVGQNSGERTGGVSFMLAANKEEETTAEDLDKKKGDQPDPPVKPKPKPQQKLEQKPKKAPPAAQEPPTTEPKEAPAAVVVSPKSGDTPGSPESGLSLYNNPSADYEKLLELGPHNLTLDASDYLPYGRTGISEALGEEGIDLGAATKVNIRLSAGINMVIILEISLSGQPKKTLYFDTADNKFLSDSGYEALVNEDKFVQNLDYLRTELLLTNLYIGDQFLDLSYYGAAGKPIALITGVVRSIPPETRKKLQTAINTIRIGGVPATEPGTLYLPNWTPDQKNEDYQNTIRRAMAAILPTSEAKTEGVELSAAKSDGAAEKEDAASEKLLTLSDAKADYYKLKSNGPFTLTLKSTDKLPYSIRTPNDLLGLTTNNPINLTLVAAPGNIITFEVAQGEGTTSSLFPYSIKEGRFIDIADYEDEIQFENFKNNIDKIKKLCGLDKIYIGDKEATEENSPLYYKSHGETFQVFLETITALNSKERTAFSAGVQNLNFNTDTTVKSPVFGLTGKKDAYTLNVPTLNLTGSKANLKQWIYREVRKIQGLPVSSPDMIYFNYLQEKLITIKEGSKELYIGNTTLHFFDLTPENYEKYDGLIEALAGQMADIKSAYGDVFASKDFKGFRIIDDQYGKDFKSTTDFSDGFAINIPNDEKLYKDPQKFSEFLHLQMIKAQVWQPEETIW